MIDDIMKEIKKRAKLKNNQPITAENIVAKASKEYNKRLAAIDHNSNEAKKLSHLDSLHLSSFDRILKTSLDKSIEKELEQANLSHDIQVHNKILTSKPKIIKNLVLKIRHILQNEIRFTLNPIVDNQIKFNTHLVRVVNHLSKRNTHLENLSAHLENQVGTLENQVSTLESQVKYLEKQIILAHITRSYNHFLKREPTTHEINSWLTEITSGKISSSELSKLIQNSEEAQQIMKQNLKQKGFSFVEDELVSKEVDGHQIYFKITNKAYTESFSQRALYEDGSTMAIKNLITPGMNVIIIRANIGYFALLAARQVGPKGKVFAFEPSPNTIQILRKNVDVNGYKNIDIIQMAIFDKTGKFSQWFKDSNSNYNFLSSETQSEMINVEILTTSIDEFLINKNLKIDLLIMDAGGSEKKILDDIKTILQNNPQIKIITEYNPHALELAGSNGKEFLEKITELEFSLYLLNEKEPPKMITKEQILEDISYPNTANLLLTKNISKLK
ncbi:MAG: FkbM family methyltransferase [Nitrosopumilaceae archaeon]